MIRSRTPTVAMIFGPWLSTWTWVPVVSMSTTSVIKLLPLASAACAWATAGHEPTSLQPKRAGTTVTLSARSMTA